MAGIQVSRERAAGTARLLFVDNLRWTMIILVISMHAADTYSPLGNWYYTDRSPLSPAALVAFAAWQMYLQSFFMGLLFFIAGFFVPRSLDRKGPRQFLRDRGFRLGLPVLFYMFVLGPLTEYYVAHSWTSTAPTSLANEWIKHIRNGQFLQENGPLWFCLALLIFSAAYAGLGGRRRNPRAAHAEAPPPGTGTLIGFALAMAAATFAVRLFRPPTVLNMHLADFPQYIFLFAAGIIAARGNWLAKLPYRTGLRWMLWTLPVGFAAWLTVLFAGGAFHGNLNAYGGGWHWQAAAMNVWESFTCVAICVGLLVLYRRKRPSQGRLARFLSANAFSVYVFHPPIVIAAARLLHNVPAPPLVKFAALTAIAAAVTFVLSEVVFRRIPLLRAIL